jgi:hypothetical protein
VPTHNLTATVTLKWLRGWLNRMPHHDSANSADTSYCMRLRIMMVLQSTLKGDDLKKLGDTIDLLSDYRGGRDLRLLMMWPALPTERAEARESRQPRQKTILYAQESRSGPRGPRVLIPLRGDGYGHNGEASLWGISSKFIDAIEKIPRCDVLFWPERLKARYPSTSP